MTACNHYSNWSRALLSEAVCTKIKFGNIGGEVRLILTVA